MNDYFDELETGLTEAVRRRAHQPWYARLRALSARHRGLAVLVTAFVVATPTVAAVGAVAGWFGAGKPDFSPPAAATSGLGRVLPTAGRLLSIRVPDPDGGPPWGARLIETNRGATCIQVGRVVGGQIGSLGIDGAWHNDHRFHEIEPNNQRADICGATDGAGHGFVSTGDFGAPASVDVPLDNSGTPGRCSNPLAPHRASDGPPCPASAMRVIYAGLLGPDAKSVTYETLSGRRRVERTKGGVGAYLFVFRETGHNCDEPDGLTLLDVRCTSGLPAPAVDLQGPTAVTSVVYRDGKSCRVTPSARFVAAYTKLVHRIRELSTSQLRHRYRKMWSRFLAQQQVDEQDWLQAARPRCQPVGWVPAKLPKLTAAQVAAPLKVKVQATTRACEPPQSARISGWEGVFPCPRRVPRGDVVINGSGPDETTVVLSVSFVARQPVTTDNSAYQMGVEDPGNSGGTGSATNFDIRRGQRVVLSAVGFPFNGTYHGTVTYLRDAGKNGLNGPESGARGKFLVGRFSFKVSLKP
jgi:hypothetical protein